jgi:hypothetical protein
MQSDDQRAAHALLEDASGLANNDDSNGVQIKLMEWARRVKGPAGCHWQFRIVMTLTYMRIVFTVSTDQA